MARRKIALIFLLLFMFALILSPWASAPSPQIASSPKPAAGSPAPIRPDVAEQEPVHLRVAASLNETEFEYLRKQNDRQAYLFSDIIVDLERSDPAQAYEAFRDASRIGEAADVMLLENEWVKSFAASGYLMPADGAFVGEALSEQFDVLSAPLKWNGYIWGVPRDFDPYVLVWNLAALRTVTGEAATPPHDLAQWTDLAAKAQAAEKPIHWIAMDGKDPLALLAWIQSVTGQGTDHLWNEESSPWIGTAKGEALALLEKERAGAAFGSDPRETASWVAAGQTVSAILPYSEARKLTSEHPETGSVTLSMDRTAWKLPHVWPQGRSFAVSSRTKAEDAARRWISVMTETSVQQDNLTVNGKLPVYRSLYGNGSAVSTLFPGNVSSAFPNQPPAASGPELPERLEALKALWSDFAAGKAGVTEWNRRWTETLTDFQFDD